jgi:hypothetical protein
VLSSITVASVTLGGLHEASATAQLLGTSSVLGLCVALRVTRTAPISFVRRLLIFDSCFMIQVADNMVHIISLYVNIHLGILSRYIK